MSKLATALLLLLSSVSVFAQRPPDRPSITDISHVTLFADDLAKSRDFYATLLGWQPGPENGNGPGVRFYANHEQYVELVTPPSKGLEDRLDVVAFATGDADALRAYLGRRGIEVPAHTQRDRNGGRSFLVRDPEGNKVMFTQASRKLPKKPTAFAPLSSHIMHAGYVVIDRATLDHFYKDLLGFHLYWQGGHPETRVDWVMMQVPDGTDWIEYMLYLPANPSREQQGSANHLAPGVASVAELQSRLEGRGWKPAPGKDPKVLGVDGKMQLDLLDPDGTRVEFMEFTPVGKICCSAYTGKQPGPSPSW